MLLPDRVLLLNLFYQNVDDATEVLHFNKGQKSLRKPLVTSCTLRRIVNRFEETRSFAAEAGRD